MLSNFSEFCREVYILIRSQTFIMLTIVGNGLIGLCGLVFYYLESGKNPHLVELIDAFWWSFSTATTTGYGDVTPVTTAGKVLGILLQLMGMALFSMYTGLFAEIILTSARKRRQ